MLAGTNCIVINLRYYFIGWYYYLADRVTTNKGIDITPHKKAVSLIFSYSRFYITSFYTVYLSLLSFPRSLLRLGCCFLNCSFLYSRF